MARWAVVPVPYMKSPEAFRPLERERLAWPDLTWRKRHSSPQTRLNLFPEGYYSTYVFATILVFVVRESVHTSLGAFVSSLCPLLADPVVSRPWLPPPCAHFTLALRDVVALQSLTTDRYVAFPLQQTSRPCQSCRRARNCILSLLKMRAPPRPSQIQT